MCLCLTTAIWEMMAMTAQDGAVLELVDCGGGIWAAPGARIIDRTGRKMLPIGRDGFVPVVQESVVIDKTMLIADVIDSGYAVTLFCRPRRFGKTLNMTMMKAFFEMPPAGASSGDTARLFKGTEVWEADGGRYRQYQSAYPVVHVSFNTVKKFTWEDSFAAIRNVMALEYLRHDYLRTNGALGADEEAYFSHVAGCTATQAELADSLVRLCLMLKSYHDAPVVVLIDEYDAPVMAGYTYGYYDDVVGFFKGWLTGALKDGGAALRLACLTGVQRIAKESIFSDLNNLAVSTPLSVRFEERYGFTDAEVSALAAYLGHPDCMEEARRWYDGYRFGGIDVYNPWSVLYYFDQDCAADVYWGNTSSNSVVGELIRNAEGETLSDIYELLKPDGVVAAPLDLGIVFSELSVSGDAIWSMLYLAGYLTTDDTRLPNNKTVIRRLRIPNAEVAQLYRAEIVERFRQAAGGSRRLAALHRALCTGDAATCEAELSRIVRDSASSFDMSSENGCHMLLLGLLFGVPGYEDPQSNRESGYGRYDIQLKPALSGPLSVAFTAESRRPLVTIEVKYLARQDAPQDDAALAEKLAGLAALGNRTDCQARLRRRPLARRGLRPPALGFRLRRQTPGSRLQGGVRKMEFPACVTFMAMRMKSDRPVALFRCVLANISLE